MPLPASLNTFMHEPLTDDELDHLADFLLDLESPQAMNIERLDGFFCALIAGPDEVVASEYWPQIIGRDDGAPSFQSLGHAQEIMGLLMRHWNTIAATLNRGDVYLPILLLDDVNVSRGNEWAKGFLQGVGMRRPSWHDFLANDDAADAIIPMYALAHENDTDPKLRFETPTPEKREELLHLMTAGLVRIHRYFAATRSLTHAPFTPATRTSPKMGRNDICSCGSGKKFKHCCLRLVN